MKITTKNGIVLATFLLIRGPALLDGFARQAEEPALKMATNPFLPPAGPYAVGTHEYLWIDQSRPDPFIKGGSFKRHLIVRVWYPAEVAPNAAKSAYILDPSEFSEKSSYASFTAVKTNAVTDAPLAKSQTPFPVLVYQPGGGTARFIGTFETEQLASHGYVVLAADHPGFSETTRFPDGSTFVADQHVQPKETGDFGQDVKNSWNWLNDEVFGTWTADASFTLDKIEQLNKTAGQIFYRQLDLARIGMFGWSFGGATSVEMSIDDPRVKAVVDQDGQLFGKTREKGTARPLMLMHHGGEDQPPKPEQAALLKQLIAQTKAWDDSLVDHSTGDRYEITIAKTQHGHFSDFMLAFPAGPDELDARRAHAIIIAYTEAFFDKYLRGQDSTLLKAPPSQYPEVTFSKKP
jgi:predicted dienelactone hydrolase